MKIKRFLACVLVLFVALCLVACGGSKTDYNQLLGSYLLNMDTNLSQDFTLDSKLVVGENTYDLTWTSSSEYVKIADTAVDGTYTVTVTRPAQKEDVVLTVKLGDATKEFNFSVKPYDVYDFTGAYVFPQNKTTVSSDFDLDTEFVFQGLKATIAWESMDTNLIQIAPEGNKALVTSSSIEKNVTLKAKFTYNGEESVVRYTVTVYEELDPMEVIDYWYKNTGVSQTISGYVVAVGTVFSASYNNISLYVVDDSFKAGYYLYRVGCTAEEAEKIVPGAHVTATGTTNTSYSGLMETNAGGTIVVDSDVPAINVNDHVTAIDSLLTSKSPSLIYLQSTLVSISGWKITKKLNAAERGATKSIFEVERDGVTLTIDCSKYMEGYFSPWADAADPKFDAIASKIETFAVGDYLDLTGVLGNYNGHQIHIATADLLVKSAEPTAETAGKAVAPVIESYNVPEKISEAKSFDLPATTGSVNVSWKLTKDSKVAKVEGGKLVVTPGDDTAKITLVGTYANGDFSTDVYYNITIGAVDNSVKTVEAAKALENGADVVTQGTVLAKNARGYILYDGTDAAYVYAYGSSVETEKTIAWNIGDTIKITAKVSIYKDLIELIPSASEKVEIEAKELPAYTTYEVSDIEAYVAAAGEGQSKEYAQDYVQLTGTLSISSGYYNVAIGSETAQASLSNITDELAAMIADLDGKEITFSGFAIGQSSNKFFNVMVTSIDSALPVTGAKAASNNTVVTVEGQVVATSDRGYVVYDGTDAIYVYAYGSSETFEKIFTYVQGDFVKVTGVKGFYNGDQIVPTVSELLDSGEAFELGEAKAMDQEAVNAYVAAPGEGETKSFANELVAVTGKLSANNGYYNIILSDAEGAAQASLSYLPADRKALYDTLNDQEVTVYGWTIGHSSNKYMNIIVCDYEPPLPPYVEVYVEGALYVNPAFTADNCSWGGQALTFGVNGFADLNSAIEAATDGQAIYLQSGEYMLVDPDAPAEAPKPDLTLDKYLKIYGPNAEISGTATKRYPEATIIMRTDGVGINVGKALEFYGVELKGRGIGYISGIMFQATDTTKGVIIKNSKINAVNTAFKIQKGSDAEYFIDSCDIHGINQFFAWITAGTKSFTMMNCTFNGADCGQVENANAALFRVRCACDVKLYHNVFITDEAATNPGWFEPQVTSAGSFDVQYNEFQMVTKFLFKNGENDEFAVFNNNIYTDAEHGALETYPTEIEGAGIAGVTKDANVFEDLDALNAAWEALETKPVAPTYSFEAPQPPVEG